MEQNNSFQTKWYHLGPNPTLTTSLITQQLHTVIRHYRLSVAEGSEKTNLRIFSPNRTLGVAREDVSCCVLAGRPLTFTHV